jgi:hypothetical protein
MIRAVQRLRARDLVLLLIVETQLADALMTLTAGSRVGMWHESNPLGRVMLGDNLSLDVVLLKVTCGVLVALALWARRSRLKRLAWPSALLLAGIGLFGAATAIWTGGLL